MRANDVEYFAPAVFDDEIEVFARVSRIGRTSVTFEFAAYREPDDLLMVTAHQTLVYVDLAERKAAPVPDSFREPRRRVRGRRCRRLARAARSKPSTGSSTAAATPTTSCARSSPPPGARRLRLGRDLLRRRRRSSSSGRTPAEPDATRRTSAPVVCQGERVAELAVDGARPPTTALLERVAVLVSGHCLVGWDTGGEAWEP